MPLKIFSTVLLAAVIFFTCKPKEDKIIKEVSSTATFESSDFLEFYDKFGEDSVFQLSRIAFPLEGIQSAKDDETILDPNFKWTKEDWKIHKKFDDVNGTYVREFYDLSGIVVEVISDTSGKFSMERRFGKLSSGWHLIYYREMGLY